MQRTALLRHLLDKGFQTAWHGPLWNVHVTGTEPSFVDLHAKSLEKRGSLSQSVGVIDPNSQEALSNHRHDPDVSNLLPGNKTHTESGRIVPKAFLIDF